MKNKFNILLSIILFIVYTFLNYMLFKLDLIPFKYLSIIVLVLFIIIFLLILFMLRSKTNPGVKKTLNVISIIFIIIFLVLISYVNTTHKFIKNIVSQNYEYKTYDVVVNKDKKYEDIESLENKEIGYLNKLEIENELSDDINYIKRKYQDITKIINDILDKNIDAIILEDSYYNLLKEDYDDLEQNTKIIARYKVKETKKKNTDNVSVKENPFIVYISGIDTYGSISKVSRSDVNILAVVNPNTKKILLIHIPRDYYVYLHTYNQKDKLTHAGIYGIDESEKTIEDLLGTSINYHIRLNFATLTKAIDLIDGVDVYSDKTFVPWTNRSLTIEKGMNHMDGKMALAFSRERKTYETGDRHRGQNQQAVIKAMIDKITRPEYIFKYNEILNALNMTFETNMSYKNISDLVKKQISDGKKWEVKSIGLDGTGSMNITYSMGNRNLYVMIPDQTSIENAKIEIENLTK